MSTSPEQQRGGLFPHIEHWSDLYAVAILFSMFIALLTWGLKLDNRTTDNMARLSVIDNRMNVGITPLAATKLVEVQRQIDVLQADVRDLREQNRDMTNRLLNAERDRVDRVRVK